jgi:hypothetical protein
MVVRSRSMSREPFTYAIPRFSVTRPVTVAMILLTMLVVGFIAYSASRSRSIPTARGQPALHPVPVPNASPRDVEEKVSRKIEDIVGTVPGVKAVYSYSRTAVLLGARRVPGRHEPPRRLRAAQRSHRSREAAAARTTSTGSTSTALTRTTGR